MARGPNPRKAMRDAKRAVSQYNSAVRKYNSGVKKYNREAKRFNREQRANRNELNKAIQAHNSSVRRQRSSLASSSTFLVESYEGLLAGVDDDHDGGGLVDLAAAEASASLRALAVMEEDEAGSGDGSTLTATVITDELSSLSTDLDDRWRGALFSMHPDNPDAARHFCTSAREVVVEMIDRYAPDEDVLAADPQCELHEPSGKPSRRAKVRHLVSVNYGEYESITEFVETDVNDVLGLFRVFNDGTHGRAGHFDTAKLRTIKERVEGAIVFLSRLLRPH